MRSWKWIIAFFSMTFFLLIPFFSITASAQIQSNRLCMHNGGEYYVVGIDHTEPNNAGGKFFPSYNHVPAKGVDSPGGTYYPWKIRGWAWTGMQAADYVNTWIWASVLQYDEDPVETFKRTVEYVIKVIDHNSPLSPVPATQLSTMGSFYGNGRIMVHPSSYGGFNSSANIFAMTQASWMIPSTLPYYSFEFAYLLPMGTSVLQPSSRSIFEYVWENAGPKMQYLIYSGDETDCTGTLGGNKGQNYSFGKMGDDNSFYYWPNECEGGRDEWAMCLLVNDAVSIPVNTPGVTGTSNPYATYGFDVGTATISPHQLSGMCSLQIMSEDYEHPNSVRAFTAALAQSGFCIPYGTQGYRLPHAMDFFTSIFLSLFTVWQHVLQSGYPACMLGTTVGGHSIAVSIPPDPNLTGIELYCATFSLNKYAPSAGYLVTFL